MRSKLHWTALSSLDQATPGASRNFRGSRRLHLLLEWMQFGDEQITANTPLVIIECLRYSMRHPKRRALHQQMLDVLSVEQLKAILKLMSTTHHVIQYNAICAKCCAITF